MQSQISDLPLIERIEVLRGPQSTLFGKNATAGVINVVTKKPSFKKSSFITTTVGNFNSQIGKILDSEIPGLSKENKKIFIDYTQGDIRKLHTIFRLIKNNKNNIDSSFINIFKTKNFNAFIVN